MKLAARASFSSFSTPPSGRSPRAVLAIAFAASLLTGCRSSPCSDGGKALPQGLEDVGQAIDGVSVCWSSGEQTGLAVWGSERDLPTLMRKTRLKLELLGWQETDASRFPGSYVSDREHKYVKGDAVLRLTYSPAKMPSFGAKIDKEAVNISASRYTDVKRSRR
jgi:hypothetical protein